MKIGIPNTLFSAYHLLYWQKLLSLLQLEIVISGPSRPDLAHSGSKLLPHEFCLPVKVFLGHVINLLEQKVDLILLPILSSRDRRNFFCPKLIGLPDIVRYTLGLDERLFFAPELFCNGLEPEMVRLPQQPLIAPLQFRKAERKANNYWRNVLSRCQKEKLTLAEIGPNRLGKRADTGVTIGLLGYAYTLYDPFISKDILRKLFLLGVTVRTWEMVDPAGIAERLQSLKRPLYWNFGKVVLGAGLHFLDDPEIDGLIYVSTFGCGPDSIATKMLSLEAGRRGKPLLLLNLDEHMETGHLQTRLEAFVDMLGEYKTELRGQSAI